MIFPSVKAHPRFLHVIEGAKFATALRNYNASLIQFDGGFVIAYRSENARGWSRIAVQSLKKNLQPSSLAFIECPEGVEHEDPRLFVADGKLYLAFIELNGRHRDGLFTQELVELGEDAKAVRRIPLAIGQNGKRSEKNWIFFDVGEGKIGVIYSLRPHRVFIISSETGSVVEEHTTPGIERWPFGTLSGGTPAVRFGDSFIHVFHSHQPDAKRSRRYSMSAAAFSAKAPYECISVSKEPLVWASDEDVSIVNPRRPNWNPLCVFPAGLFISNALDPLFAVSAGINDTSMASFGFKLADLNLVAVEKLPRNAAIVAGKEMPRGAVRVRVTPAPHGKVRSLGEPGGRYVTGDEFITTPARAAALGAQVEVIG
jgi:predicted GH43/DUF377 family glycosyl hydrolase